jgi:hypothetical protein
VASRLPWDRKVAGSIHTSDGGILKKIKFVIFLSPWSLGSEIRHLALSDNGEKQMSRVQVACIKNPLVVEYRKEYAKQLLPGQN